MAADCKKADDESSDPSQAAKEATEPAPSAGTQTEPPSEAAAGEAEAQKESPSEEAPAAGAPTASPAAESADDSEPRERSITDRETEDVDSEIDEDLGAAEFSEKADREIQIISSQMGDYQQQLEQMGDRVDSSYGDRFIENAEARNKLRERLEAFKKRSDPPRKKIEQMQKRLQTLKQDWMKLRKDIESEARKLQNSE
jgi:chaperonin cofactor prefoldin